MNLSTFEGVISTVARVGVIRWGRTSSGMANWRPTKMASVSAIAGIVRRNSIPRVTPRAKANAA